MSRRSGRRGRAGVARWLAAGGLIASAVVTVPAPGAGAQVAPGDGFVLDTSFGSDGIVTTDIGSLTDLGNAVAVQADGRIVVAGTARRTGNEDFAVVRYKPDGSPDTSFDIDGKVTTNFGTVDRAFAVAVQTVDGEERIVVAGAGNSDFAVVRYKADGSPDTGFSGDGKVTTDVSGVDAGYAVAVDAENRIVVAGFSHGNTRLAVVRYEPDGSLDTSFDGDGKVITNLGGGFTTAYAVAVQPDGRIVVAGVDDDEDFTVVRYKADGSLDTSFGGDGKVTTDVGGVDLAQAVAVLPGGRIVVAGSTSASTAAEADFAVVRYEADGSPDTGFGTGGKVITDVRGHDRGFAVAVLPGGRIVVAGFTKAGATVGGDGDFAVVRYAAGGAVEARARTPVAAGTGDDGGFAVAVQADGRIVVAGRAAVGSYPQFAVVRYLAPARGSPVAVARSSAVWATDPTFGRGMVGLALDDCGMRGRDVAVDAAGRVVVVGSAPGPGAGGCVGARRGGAVVARWTPAGALDASFAAAGVVRLGDRSGGVGGGGGDDRSEGVGASEGVGGGGAVGGVGGVGGLSAVALQAVGGEERIVLAGHVAAASGSGGIAPLVMRLRADGSRDRDFAAGDLRALGVAGDARLWDVAVDAEGRIVAVGEAGADFLVVRLLAGGAPDASFGAGGVVVTDVGDAGAAFGVAIRSDGRIVAAGRSGGSAAVARYLPGGAPDVSFGVGGLVVDGAWGGWARGVALGEHGKVVVVGDGPDGVVLARLRLGGRRHAGSVWDSNFGDPDDGGGPFPKRLGWTVIPREEAGGPSPTGGPYPAGTPAVAADAGGSLWVAATAAGAAGDTDLMLLRFRRDGAPDRSFGDGGRIISAAGAHLATTVGAHVATTVGAPADAAGRDTVASTGAAGGHGTRRDPSVVGDGDDRAAAAVVAGDGAVFVAGSARRGGRDLPAVARFDLVASEPPGVPRNFGHGVHADRVELHWVEPALGPAAGYRILRRDRAAGETELAPRGYVASHGGGAARWADRAVIAGRSYDYAVVALNVAGAGEPTATLTARVRRFTPADSPARPAPPALRTLIGDRTLIVGDPATLIELGAAFTGEEVLHGAVADDGRIVHVALTGTHLAAGGTHLALTALAPGTTIVTVTASNPSGAALQTFTVTAR